MASTGSRTPLGPGPQGAVVTTDQAQYRDANDNRSLTAGLAGTCIAILTFVMFFLFDRWKHGEVNDLLFQWAVLNIVASMFLVSVSSMNFWLVMEALKSNHPRPGKYQRRAEVTFASSWVLLLLEPTLIFAAVGLVYATAVAFALWLVGTILLGMGWSDAR
jgi:hypothetical protein